VEDQGAMTDRETAEPPAQTYSVTVCAKCDPVRPEHIGAATDDVCPECGAQMFGLTGSEQFVEEK
jgi:hypothetical protein